MDTLAAVVPETHPLAVAKSIRLRELAAAPFVLFGRGQAVGLFDQIISACQREKFEPVISSQPETMQKANVQIAKTMSVRAYGM